MTHAKRPVKSRPTPAPAGHNDRDAAIAQLIAGLNYLVAQSQAANLGTAARILCTAKEDMVHWAVDMNFHESARERFINGQLFGPLNSHASGLVAAMEQGETTKPSTHPLHKKS